MRDRIDMTRTNNVRAQQQDMDRIRRQAEHMRNQAIGQAVRDIRSSARQLMGNLRVPVSISRRAGRRQG